MMLMMIQRCPSQNFQPAPNLMKLSPFYMRHALLYATCSSRSNANILQELGIIPQLKPEEIFSSSNPDYYGPKLPPRYGSLLLLTDWYRPGKMRRKKDNMQLPTGKSALLIYPRVLLLLGGIETKKRRHFVLDLQPLGFRNTNKNSERTGLFMIYHWNQCPPRDI